MLVLSLMCLTACGVTTNPGEREIRQPITIPLSMGGPVTRTYEVLSTSMSCYFNIVLSNGQELPSQYYWTSCEYTDRGLVKSVTVEFYYTLPGVGYLSYYY